MSGMKPADDPYWGSNINKLVTIRYFMGKQTEHG
jgi:hypothetical protein